MKTFICFISCVLFLGPLSGYARAKKIHRKNFKTRAHAPVSIKKNKKYFYHVGISTILWQESIDANRAGVQASLDSEFKGVGLTGTLRKPIPGSRWEQSYGAEWYFGTLLSKGNAVIQDELEKQPWHLFTVNPGVVYPTSRFSEVGISIPLTFRSIEWKLDDPTLRLDKRSSFSYGLSFNYLSYVAKNHAFNFSLTSHIQWSATLWTLGWKHRL